MDSKQTVKNVKVTCPQCNHSKFIDVPTYLFNNKKADHLKVQINAGMGCDHEYVAFISRSGEIMGYETIDVVLNLADFQKTIDRGHIFLPDLLKIFGKYGVSNQFHAILLNTPIQVIRCEDYFNYAKPLTTLFNEFLPDTYKKHLIIVSNLLEKNFKNAKIKDKFVFNDTGVVVNAPWNQIKLKFEEDLILKALNFLDPKMQIAYIQEQLNNTFTHAAYIAEKIQNSKIFDDDLINDLNLQFFREFDMKYFELLKQIAAFRFHANLNKIVNRRLSKLQESLW